MNSGQDSSPCVSVIMNCLNGEKDLQEALASVQAQTFQDFEIIFWDNGSTDGSAAIAKSFGPKLRYFKGDKTVPLGAARNLAIEKSQGRFVAFLDCDDIWRDEKLEKQVALFESNPEVGLVCTDTEVYDGKRVLYKMFDQSLPERGHVFPALMKRQWISMSSAMIRREALEELKNAVIKEKENRENAGWFDESLNVCEEADVFYRIAHDWELDYIDEPLTVWRVHGGNTTFGKFDQFAQETLSILEKHRRIYSNYDREHGDIVEMLVGRAAFQKAVALWKAGKGADARREIEPYLRNSNKNRLFWLASFLPGAMFDLLSRFYFALPPTIRR